MSLDSSVFSLHWRKKLRMDTLKQEQVYKCKQSKEKHTLQMRWWAGQDRTKRSQDLKFLGGSAETGGGKTQKIGFVSLTFRD
jgi:hypothetical protein